ncbi:MAG TPA: hypothetical protein VHZ07_19585 [Bryobacteraceae bacterium]|jgi:hypothetical protein|nr:hypothetical protein [Bryobacteraceae bacterium]
MRTFLQSALLLVLVAGAVFATKKVISPTTSGDNDSINVTATLFIKPDEVVQEIGANPGPDIVVLHVRVTPKVDKPVSISPDDFILLAHDDGERNQPYDPSEIAGKGVLIIKEQKQDSVGVDPVRSTIAGIAIGGLGNNKKPADDSKTPTGMNDKDTGNNDLLTKLKTKELATQDIQKPVEGLLYFKLTGKHKLKNMAVLYRGPSGDINMEFEH